MKHKNNTNKDEIYVVFCRVALVWNTNSNFVIGISTFVMCSSGLISNSERYRS